MTVALVLEKLEAALTPPKRKCLRVIIDGDDESAKAKKKQEASASTISWSLQTDDW
jgi:hypothetical protein